MALPDWNADMSQGKKLANPSWSPCSPSETTIRKEQAARHAHTNMGTIANPLNSKEK